VVRSSIERAMRTELEVIFRNWGRPYHRPTLERFLADFAQPEAVARGMVAFAREFADHPSGTGASPSFLADTFLLRNLSLLTDDADFPLLRFPPGDGIFPLAARTIPAILERHLQAAFPGLAEVLRGLRPDLAPDVPILALVEEIGFEDVLTGVMGANTGVYHLRLRGRADRLILKRTDMAVEQVIAALLEDVLDLPAVRIRWSGPLYSVMEPSPGASLRELSGNPLLEPRRKRWPTASRRRPTSTGWAPALSPLTWGTCIRR